MNHSTQKRALECAIAAAKASGALMKKNFRSHKKVNFASQYDIKLELDVRCQKLIEGILADAFPEIALLGEEGNQGDSEAEYRWVVDPIDGTVNFSYEIPHCCVSIALQQKVPAKRVRRPGSREKRSAGSDKSTHSTLLGVVYDPFCDELWTAVRGQPARLNGKSFA